MSGRRSPALLGRGLLLIGLVVATLSIVATGCGGDEAAAGAPVSDCGPTSGTVARVVDGDTIELTSGEKIRYLMVDTPESTTQKECWGEEAKAANKALVEGQEVTLRYDVECKDRYGRLLAYVSVGGAEVNSLLIQRGHACVLHIGPNGDDRVDEFREFQADAKTAGKGLWADCQPLPCGQ